MSGLAATETRLDGGAVDVRIGEGRTAEVLRNICYGIYEEDSDSWGKLVEQVSVLFGAELDPPRYVVERGEITMSYRERNATLDLSSAGRGLQQTLLILAYMYANPGAVLLLDEPDAHLEILRQRQIYERITSAARSSGSQVIAASHSEVLLNEAAGNDSVVAFVGRPHRIDNRRDEVLKSLREIGFEQYYQAEQTGWVLYLEGSTDMAILRSFAARTGHELASKALEQPFVRYVSNVAKAVPPHFNGLREALPDLAGLALFDRLDGDPPALDSVECLMWNRREIENYLCSRAALEAYAATLGDDLAVGPLFAESEARRHVIAMTEAIAEIETALSTLGKGSPWGSEVKASDDVLVPVFARYFAKLGLRNRMPKRHLHELVQHLPIEEIDDDVYRTLDAIAAVAAQSEANREDDG